MALTLVQQSVMHDVVPPGYSTPGDAPRIAQTNLPAATTAGNLLVCVVRGICTISTFLGQSNPVPPVFSTPTTPGLTWILAASASQPAFGSSADDPIHIQTCPAASIYYCENAPSIDSSTWTTAVITGPGPHNAYSNHELTVWLLEFSGIAISGSLDAVATAIGVSGAPGAGSITCAATDLVLVADCESTGYTQGTLFNSDSAGSGFTLIANPPFAGIVIGFGPMQYGQFSSGIVPTAFSGAVITNQVYADVAVAFKAAVQPSAGKLLAFYRLDGFPGHDAEIPSGALNGANVTFSLAFAPNPAASVFLYKNGNFMVQGTDYTLGVSPGSSIGVITMAKAPASGDHLIAWYRSDGGTLGIADNEVPLGVIDGINPDFTLAHSALPGTLVLFQRKADGSSCISLAPTGIDYTNAGTLILLNIAPAVGDTLRAFYRYTPPATS